MFLPVISLGRRLSRPSRSLKEMSSESGPCYIKKFSTVRPQLYGAISRDENKLRNLKEGHGTVRRFDTLII